MKNKNLVAVFDVDGTLIDSDRKIVHDVVIAYQRLGIVITPEQAKGDWNELAKSHGIPIMRFYQEFDKRKSWQEAIESGEVTLFSDTIPCLEKLVSHDIVLTILTKSTSVINFQKLHLLNLAHYFKRAVVVNPTSSTKKYGALYLISELCPAKIRRVYFIGDNLGDVVVDKDVNQEIGVQAQGVLLRRQGKTVLPDDEYRSRRHYATSLAEVSAIILNDKEKSHDR